MDIFYYEGVGYILIIYFEDKEIICEFVLKKLVFCFLVNILGVFGGIGVIINFVFVLIFGCGVVGGSLLFDNIGFENFFNICCIVIGVLELEDICKEEN